MTRFSQLSAPRQALVRLCQSTNYGTIHNLVICDSEPAVTSSAPGVLVDFRLDLEERPRQELAVVDFELCAELNRLMVLLDRIENGSISKIEVRAGIPRRVMFESRVSGVREVVT